MRAEEDEDGDTILNPSALRNLIKEFTNVDIMLDPDTFKSTYQILLEISKVWKDLTDAQQAVLLEKIAGKHRASAVAALLNDQETLVTAYEDALNSAGSAQAEFEKRTSSIEYHLKQLYAAWQELATNTATVEFVNMMIDAARAIVEFVNEVGALKIAVGGLGFLFGSFGHNTIIPALVDTGRQAVIVSENMNGMNRTIDDFGRVLDETGTPLRNTDGSIRQFSRTALAARGATTALKTVLTSLAKSFGVMTVAVLAVTAIGKIVDWYKEQKHEVENLSESINDLNTKITDLKAQYDELDAKELKTEGEEKKLQLLEKQIALEEKSLELQKQRKASAITNNAEEYFSGTELGISSDFSDSMNNAEKSVNKYKTALEDLDKYSKIIDEQEQVIRDLGNVTNEFSSEAIELSRAQSELNFATNNYNKTNEQLGELFEDAKNDLAKLYEEQENLTYAIRNGTAAEKISAEQSLATLKTKIYEHEVILGIADTTEHLTESINDQEKSLKLLDSIIVKVTNGQKISKKELEELGSLYPALSNLVVEFGTASEDGYIISKNALESLNSTQASAALNMTNSQIDLTKTTISQVSQRINAYYAEMKAIQEVYKAEISAYKKKRQESLAAYDKENTIEIDGRRYYKDGKSMADWRSKFEAENPSPLNVNEDYQNALKSIEEQKDLLEEQRLNLGKYLKQRDELQKKVNSSPIVPTGPGGGSSSSDKEKEDTKEKIELYDLYQNKIDGINESLKGYDDALNKTNAQLELNQTYEERTPELIAEETALYKKLAEQTEAKRKAQNDALWEENHMLENLYAQLQNIAGIDKSKLDFSALGDADLDQWAGLNITGDFADSEDGQRIKQIIDAIKTLRSETIDLNRELLETKKTIIEMTREDIEVEFKLQDNAIDKMESARDITQQTLDILDNLVGAEQQRINLTNQLIPTYSKERDAVYAMYQSNLNQLDEIGKKYGKNSSVYLEANKMITEQNKKLHERTLQSIQEEYNARKKILEIQQQQAEKQLEISIYGESGQDAWEDNRQAEIDKLQDELDALDDKNDEEDYLKQVEEKEKEIADLQEKLNNLRNQKTIQQLEQQADGSYQWTYVEDQKAINETLDDIESAKEDLQKLHDDKQLEDQKQAIQDKIDAIQSEIDERQNQYDREMEIIQNSYEEQMNALDQWAIDETNKNNERIKNMETFGKNYDKAVKKALETATKTAQAQFAVMGNVWGTAMSGIFTEMSGWVTDIISEFHRLEEARRQAEAEAAEMTGGGYSISGHANGLRFVEANNMLARLHYGERVLTRQEAAQYNAIEDDIKSGALESYFATLKNDTLDSISMTAMSNLPKTTVTPTTNNSSTQFIIENLQLPNVKDPNDFAKQIQAWSHKEFGGLAQKAKIRSAK